MGGNVSYEEQEYRVLKDATDWWKIEEFPDGPDFPQYAKKFQEEGWFDCRKWHPERWGTYRRWEMGYRRQQGGYNLYAAIDEVRIHDPRPPRSRSGPPSPRPTSPTAPRRSRKPARPIALHMTARFPTSTSSRTGSSRRTPRFRPRSTTTKDPADKISTTDAYINDNYKGDHLVEEYKEENPRNTATTTRSS